jgi:hypothetical protein
MVLRDGARFIVLLCQPQGLAARNAPLRLLVSSVPVCANIEYVVPPVCVTMCASVPVCASGATSSCGME